MGQCWPLQMPPSPKAVLMSLADQANDYGLCYPSVGTICKRTCLGERTVQAAIKWLVGSGILTVNREPGRATNYQINPAGFGANPDLFTAPARGAPPHQRHPRSNGTTPPQQAHPTPAAVAGDPRKSGTHNLKKKENQGKKAKFDATAIDLPPWLPKELWLRWVKDRKQRGKPITEDAAELQLKQLERHRDEGNTPKAVIEHSIAGGFQGLYAPKKRPGDPVEAESSEWFETRKGCETKAREIGLPKWDETEPFSVYRDRVRAKAEQGAPA